VTVLDGNLPLSEYHFRPLNKKRKPMQDWL